MNRSPAGVDPYSLLQKVPRGITCLFAGAVLPLAYAPYGIFPLAFLCPAVLFLCWRNAPPGVAFRRGYLFGLGMFGTGVFWLHISINLFGGMNLPASILLTLLLIAFLALYPAAVGFAGRRLQCGSGPLFLAGALPALWVLAEWLRTWILTGFPWLHLGYSQSDTPLRHFAVLAGVFGVSWAVALAAGALCVCVHGGGRRRGGALTGIALIVLGGWLAGLADWTDRHDVERGAALVQGAIPQELKWQPQAFQTTVDRYVGLTEPHWDNDIIIWPETAIPAFRHQLPGLMAELARRADAGGADLFIGLPVLDEGGAAYFNSVVVPGRPERTYHKRHLVPFGEYLPLPSLLGRVVGFLEIPMSEFSAGAADKPLLTGDGVVAGVSICYEDAFGEEVIQSLPEAQVLINVSNDAWFGDSSAPHQHLQMARMRAVETGRYLLRATNTGISAVIDEKGRILHRSPQFEPAVISARIALFEGTTPYAAWGNLPVIIAALLVVIAAWRRERGPLKLARRDADPPNRYRTLVIEDLVAQESYPRLPKRPVRGRTNNLNN